MCNKGAKMKTPINITLIILLSFFMVGVMYLVIKKNSIQINHLQSKEKTIDNERFSSKDFMISKEELSQKKILNEEEIKISYDDEKLIQNIALLSDQQLEQKMQQLRKLSQEQRLGEIIQLKNTQESVVKEAKKILEELAIMGLEATRRKFLKNDPELQDPIKAHSLSLLEIRSALDE